MKRKSETPAMARRILLRQGIVPCCLCGKRLKPEDKLIREHLHALCLDGPDDEDNMGYAHEACADLKTNGPKHMGAGDKYDNAKSKRLARGGKKPSKRKIQNGKASWAKRPLRSRGFQKRPRTEVSA